MLSTPLPPKTLRELNDKPGGSFAEAVVYAYVHTMLELETKADAIVRQDAFGIESGK